MDDCELMRGLRQHDAVAFQLVRERYLPSIWRYVLTRVDGDRHVAEDIVSETMLAMIQAFGATTSAATDADTPAEGDAADVASSIQNLGGWMRAVANHKVQDYFRAAARVRHLIEGARQQATEADPSDDPARQHEAHERRLEVRQAMDQLPEQYRIGLEWKYLEKLSVREISARWGTTEKAAESILFRARRELRERLKLRAVPAAAEPRPAGGRSPLDAIAEQNLRNIPRTACDVSEL